MKYVGRQETDEVEDYFKQWKKGTFFMKMCELMYNYQLRDREQYIY